MKRIFLGLILFLFLFNSSYSEARIIRELDISKQEPLILPQEELFDQLSSEIEKIHPSNQAQGRPTLIGWSGYTGSGQSTTAKEFAEKLEDMGFKVTVLGCDDYIIPKKERVTRAVVSFPKPGGVIRISGTRITIRGIDEDTVGVKIPSLGEPIEVTLKEIGKEVQVEGTDIYLMKQRGDRIIVHIPVFISKIDWIFYRDIMDLKKGKRIPQPQFDQETRERLQLTQEELGRLKRESQETEQIRGNTYLVLDKQQGTIADAETGLIYKIVDPEGIIIIEGVWAMLRPEANESFDKKVFVLASEETRLKRAGMRHILEGRYKGRMIDDIVKEMAINWWETQDEFAERQMEKAEYILDNDIPFSPYVMFKRFGTEEERVELALSTYQEDLKADDREEIVPEEALKYVWYVLSDDNPLENAIEHIIWRYRGI